MATDQPLVPLNDCVLIEPEPLEDYTVYKKYPHLVMAPRYAHGPEDRPVWGRIIALGSQCKLSLSVGERVVIGKWAAAKVRHQDKDYLIVRDYDILAVDDGHQLP